MFMPALHQHLSLAVRIANTMNTVALQESIHQPYVLLNDLIMLMGPLSQYEASACTFKDIRRAQWKKEITVYDNPKRSTITF